MRAPLLIGIAVLLIATNGAWAVETDGQIRVFVRSTAEYEQARDDLLAIAPDGVHMPQLSADPQVAARQAAELRAAGVRYLFQYKDLFTRPPSVLQRMYDEWDAHEMAHPRPEVGPDGWAQRGPDGEILLAYSGSRYMMCPSNPYWRAISYDTIIALARNYGDGVMCDNPMCMCYCEHCQAAFDAWLRREHSAEEIAGLYGRDTGDDPLPMYLPNATAETQRALLGVCRRFWTWAMADFLREQVKAAGESVHGAGNFLVAPNSGGQKWFWSQTSRGVEPVLWGDAVSTMYVEPGQFAGTGTRGYMCGLQESFMHRNWFDYHYALSRPAGTESVLHKAYTGVLRNPAMARLAMAEGFALGGTFVIYPPTSKYPGAPDMNLEWAAPIVRFIHEHRDLAEGARSAARIGVVYSPWDMMFGHDRHYHQVLATMRLLQRQHVPHRLIHAARLAEDLREHDTDLIILPHLRHLDDAGAEALEQFGAGGGALLTIGAVPDRTLLGDPRTVSFGGERSIALDLEMSETLPASAALLYESLCRLLPYAPAVADPGQNPELAVELQRTDEALLVHLLSYAAPMNVAPPAPEAEPLLRDITLTVPVSADPEITLIRPEMEDVTLTGEAVPGGVRVTVPEMREYALLAVTGGAEGPPPAAPVDDPVEAGRRAAAAIRMRREGAPARLEAVTVDDARQAGDRPPSLRNLTEWYLRITDDRPLQVVEVSVAGRSGGHPLQLRLISLEGTTVAEASSGSGPSVMDDWSEYETLSLPTAGPGDYLLLASAGANLYRMRPRCASAVVVAGGGRSLNVCDPEPLQPLYFHVPEGCASFELIVSAPQASETCHLLVRDADGRVVADEPGEMDEAVRIALEVPPDQAGRAWSVETLAPEEGRQDDVFITLRGIQSFIADAPRRLAVMRR